MPIEKGIFSHYFLTFLSVWKFSIEQVPFTLPNCGRAPSPDFPLLATHPLGFPPLTVLPKCIVDSRNLALDPFLPAHIMKRRQHLTLSPGCLCLRLSWLSHKELCCYQLYNPRITNAVRGNNKHLLSWDFGPVSWSLVPIVLLVSKVGNRCHRRMKQMQETKPKIKL